MSKLADYRSKNYAVARDPDGLLDHLCRQMEFVASKDITLDEAKEQANLVKQANNVLRYKLDVKKFERSNDYRSTK